MPASLDPAAPLLVPASRFNIEQLTAAYNQTRVDYLVPMPMNAARLAEYIDVYDVDLDHSYVALDGGQILGLGMLGVRSGRGWVTRLGVLPINRRAGVGEAISRALLAAADGLHLPRMMLEVIRHNVPAHALFLKLGFKEMGELVVLRRPPGPPAEPPAGAARWLERDAALNRLCDLNGRHAWTNQCESLTNAPDVLGLVVELPDGAAGWMVFRRQKFMLTHFVLGTNGGHPAAVGQALLGHLHQRFPELDAHVENIPGADPHLPEFYRAGYVESFWRMEMWREEPGAPRSA
jgi:ribosomal protein S18 acetylase RimI-like enzyme